MYSFFSEVLRLSLFSPAEPNPWEEIVVDYCDINPVIKESSVFQDLINPEDGKITLQKQFYFTDFKDLLKCSFYEILNKMRFWNINPLPYEVLNHFYDHFYENKDKYRGFDRDYLNYFEEIWVIIITQDISYEAARFGSLNLLKIAVANNKLERKLDLCRVAAINGHLDCLIFAHKNGCPIDDEWILNSTARSGHLHCLKYLHENGYLWKEHTFKIIATRGHLNCLMYSHENGYPKYDFICFIASTSGHLKFLEYAHKHHYPLDPDICTYTAKNGHLHCLKYLHESGCKWDERTCRVAASNGKLDCLKYAHEHGCPWDDWTCLFAAEKGHLDCLKYAIEHGCPWDREKCLHVCPEGACKQYILAML